MLNAIEAEAYARKNRKKIIGDLVKDAVSELEKTIIEAIEKGHYSCTLRKFFWGKNVSLDYEMGKQVITKVKEYFKNLGYGITYFDNDEFIVNWQINKEDN